MQKLGIVILNYLNYQDTMECVGSILEMGYPVEAIVIVDNHSGNDSYKVLKKEYQAYDNIIVIKANKNYGFAKGNNIGIRIVRQTFHVDFVFVVNNDTVFVNRDYFTKLLSCYTPGTGVIGSAICLNDNQIQQEIRFDISLKANLYMWVIYYLKRRKKDIWRFLVPTVKKGNIIRILNGCALLLTPDFFQYYSGFYDKTFLYEEEPILYLMCKKHSLQQKYVKNTFICHKEDQSSEMSFQNNPDVINSYTGKSHKYVIWWILKDKIYEKSNHFLNRFLRIPISLENHK